MFINNHFTKSMDNDYCLISVFGHSSRANRPQPKQKKRSVVNDLPVTDDTLVYAQPNQTDKRAHNGALAKGRKGKSTTGKGKRSCESRNINFK